VTTAHYITRRVAEVPITLFIISLLIFSLIHLAPGDPLSSMFGVEATPEVIQAAEKRYNLDEPLYRQYLNWISQTIRGDLGTSIMTGQPVTDMIRERLPVTASLALTAAVLSWVLAIPAGIMSAVRRQSPFDYAAMIAATIAVSIPDFIFGLVLILVLAVNLGILPTTGFVPFWDNPVEWMRHIVMPAFALAAIQTALLLRMIRSSFLDVLGEDYIRTARSKGLGERTVVGRHAMKNALIPAVTTITINAAQLLGGSIIIEQVFAIPGMGRLLIDAVLRRDYPVIQGLTLVMGLIFVLSSVIADFIYSYLDPRIRV
jgi:peptide/nickel transport system permease protein